MIGDAAEDACIDSGLSGSPSGSTVWIGLVQSATGAEPAEGWAWMNGDAIAYANWAAREPNDANGRLDEDCGGKYASMTGPWNDSECTLPQAFVCER